MQAASLTNQITARLLEEPMVEAGLDVIWAIMLRWVCLLDINLVQLYLRESLEQAWANGQLSSPIYHWSEARDWPEPRQRAHAFGYAMRFIVNAGFTVSNQPQLAVQPQTFTKEIKGCNIQAEGKQSLNQVKPLQAPSYAPHFSIYETIALPIDRKLAGQLLELLPGQAVKVIAQAASDWAWQIDPQRLRTQIVMASSYRGGEAPSDLINQIFYNLYLSLESLWWHGFTDNVIAHWQA